MKDFSYKVMFFTVAVTGVLWILYNHYSKLNNYTLLCNGQSIVAKDMRYAFFQSGGCVHMKTKENYTIIVCGCNYFEEISAEKAESMRKK